jgi:hypothetical protein
VGQVNDLVGVGYDPAGSFDDLQLGLASPLKHVAIQSSKTKNPSA